MNSDFHPDDELTAEELAERIAEQNRNLDQSDATDAAHRIQNHHIYGNHVEAPDVHDFAALERVGWTVEQVIAWLPARDSGTEGRAR
jgi:hypothetical protein